MKERLLKVEEVALLINRSVYTIKMWYRFKKLHPEHELSQMLPDIIQNGNYQTRYWRYSDLPMFFKFMENIPKGRQGFMQEVSQKYYDSKKRKEKRKNAKLKSTSKRVRSK